MYQFKINEDEINKKIAKSTSQEVDGENKEAEKTAKDILSENFSSIDEKYSNVLSSDNKFEETELNLERVEASKPTNDEVEEMAKESLSDYYNQGVANLKSNANEESEELNKRIKSETESANSRKESVNYDYEQAKSQAEDQAIRRGLARSSIIMKQLENYDLAKQNELNEIDKNLASTLGDLNSEISSLQTKLNESLNNFDLSYAVKLQDKINSLKQEAEDKYSEAVKYNNELAEKEAEFKAEQNSNKADYANKNKQQELEIAELIAKYGKSALLEVMNEEKYKIAREYLNALPKQEALNELKQDAYYYMQQLGSYYYSLYNELTNR